MINWFDFFLSWLGQIPCPSGCCGLTERGGGGGGGEGGGGEGGGGGGEGGGEGGKRGGEGGGRPSGATFVPARPILILYPHPTTAGVSKTISTMKI